MQTSAVTRNPRAVLWRAKWMSFEMNLCSFLYSRNESNPKQIVCYWKLREKLMRCFTLISWIPVSKYHIKYRNFHLLPERRSILASWRIRGNSRRLFGSEYPFPLAIAFHTLQSWNNNLKIYEFYWLPVVFTCYHYHPLVVFWEMVWK